jgi:GT2 family glycosyltransferase
VIPVLGIPCLNRFDLLERCLASIPGDLCSRIVVVDNGDSDFTSEDARVHVIRPGHNLGVAASWNLVIKANPKKRWWAMANADVEFSRADLERLIEGMRTHDLTMMGGFLTFGVRASCIAKVGWFDENFVPAYYEDNDFVRRCELVGASITNLPQPTEHFGSATIRSSAFYRTQNDRSFPANQRYYLAKWGGLPEQEVYTTPFDAGGSPRDWTLDMTRLADLSWEQE